MYEEARSLEAGVVSGDVAGVIGRIHLRVACRHTQGRPVRRRRLAGALLSLRNMPARRAAGQVSNASAIESHHVSMREPPQPRGPPRVSRWGSPRCYMSTDDRFRLPNTPHTPRHLMIHVINGWCCARQYDGRPRRARGAIRSTTNWSEPAQLPDRTAEQRRLPHGGEWEYASAEDSPPCPRRQLNERRVASSSQQIHPTNIVRLPS